jgi:hypothetical protein
MPHRIAEIVGDVDIVSGCDPLFIGLHSFSEASDRRSYKETAHVAYEWHLNGPRNSRRTTMVLPTDRNIDPRVIVHEFGHVLHQKLHFVKGLAPVTRYATTNNDECFAESFAAWINPLSWYQKMQEPLQRDKFALHLFESISSS